MVDGMRKPKENQWINRFRLTLSYPTRYVASLWDRTGVGRLLGRSLARITVDFGVSFSATDTAGMPVAAMPVGTFAITIPSEAYTRVCRSWLPAVPVKRPV